MTEADYEAEYERYMRRLHELKLAGLDESEEAELARDASDVPWSKMSEEGRQRMRKLAAEL